MTCEIILLKLNKEFEHPELYSNLEKFSKKSCFPQHLIENTQIIKESDSEKKRNRGYISPIPKKRSLPLDFSASAYVANLILHDREVPQTFFQRRFFQVEDEYTSLPISNYKCTIMRTRQNRGETECKVYYLQAQI